MEQSTDALLLGHKLKFLLSLERGERLAVLVYENIEHWHNKIKEFDPEQAKFLLELLSRVSDRTIVENFAVEKYNESCKDDSEDISSSSDDCETCEARRNEIEEVHNAN